MEEDIDAQMRAAEVVDAEVVVAETTVVDAAPANNGSRPAPASNGAAETAPNGSGAATAIATAVVAAPAETHTQAELQSAAVQAVLADKMGDAPLCDTCGHITVRNGSCYRCLNCGDSKGCS
jgi:ribonucleoside-diphosphate reductase alpha chain